MLEFHMNVSRGVLEFHMNVSQSAPDQNCTKKFALLEKIKYKYLLKALHREPLAQTLIFS